MVDSISPDHEELLLQAALHSNKSVVQWFEAASRVHDKQHIAQMLAESSALVGASHYRGTTALHHAARYGHDLIAAHLLAESPKMADAIDQDGWDALRLAVSHGHDKVVAVLLAMSPKSIHAVNGIGKTALHYAARVGHDKVVAQLLDANPNLLNAVDFLGWTPLHCAALNGKDAVVEMLLAIKPEMIQSVAPRDDTVLHLASKSGSPSKQFYARLLALHPAALRATNSDSRIPFEIAVLYDNDCAIEVMQSQLVFDEIANAFKVHGQTKPFQERLRPILEQQCERLTKLLSRDVMGAVFEYLGLPSIKRPQVAKGNIPI